MAKYIYNIFIYLSRHACLHPTHQGTEQGECQPPLLQAKRRVVHKQQATLQNVIDISSEEEDDNANTPDDNDMNINHETMNI